MTYQCAHCPTDENGLPIEDAFGFEYTIDLADHIIEEHPKLTEHDDPKALVQEWFEEAEEFIDTVIEPTIAEMEAVENESAPFGVGWSSKVDKAINTLARARWDIRRRMEGERDALHRDYFRDLAEEYAKHYAEYDEDDYDIKPEPYHRYVPLAMAYEASEELGYEVNQFQCLDWIDAMLPEDHRRHTEDMPA